MTYSFTRYSIPVEFFVESKMDITVISLSLLRCNFLVIEVDRVKGKLKLTVKTRLLRIAFYAWRYCFPSPLLYDSYRGYCDVNARYLLH